MKRNRQISMLLLIGTFLFGIIACGKKDTPTEIMNETTKVTEAAVTEVPTITMKEAIKDVEITEIPQSSVDSDRIRDALTGTQWYVKEANRNAYGQPKSIRFDLIDDTSATLTYVIDESTININDTAGLQKNENDELYITLSMSLTANGSIIDLTSELACSEFNVQDSDNNALCKMKLDLNEPEKMKMIFYSWEYELVAYKAPEAIEDAADLQIIMPCNLFANGYVKLAVNSAHEMYVWGEGALEGIVDDDLIGAAVEPTKLLDGVVAVDEQQLFLKEDGTLWGWDWNVSCIKGYTSMDYDEEYAYPLLNHVVCMDAGGAYTGNKFGAAIKDDGTLWVWGSNSAGQIGLSDSYITYSPTKVMKDVIEVSCGNSYIMVLKSDGTVWASGSNENNKLGVDTDLNKVSEFTFVMDGVAHICAGFNTSYVIKKDGTLWGWGENKTGILGQGDTTDRSEPVKIMESVAAVATNQKATYFIRTDGTLYEMGYGYWESGMSRTPTQISEDAAFSGLTLTGSALMLVTQEGVLWYKQNDNLEQYELNILG